MNDVGVGSAFRAVRMRLGWTQEAVAARAHTSRPTVSRLERGQLSTMPISTLRAVSNALGISIEIQPRWRGANLDRLLTGAHTALHESVALGFRGLPDWTLASEVSYSIYGERGVIDIIAWHHATRSLLIIELKTLLVDIGDLLASMDRRVRLAPRIVQDRGWDPSSVSAWVILTDTRTNRRHVGLASAVLDTAFPRDGRAMRAWLRAPHGAIHALSFWSDARALIHSRVATVRGRRQEVRRARTTPADAARPRPPTST